MSVRHGLEDRYPYQTGYWYVRQAWYGERGHPGQRLKKGAITAAAEGTAPETPVSSSALPCLSSAPSAPPPVHPPPTGPFPMTVTAVPNPAALQPGPPRRPHQYEPVPGTSPGNRVTWCRRGGGSSQERGAPSCSQMCVRDIIPVGEMLQYH